MKVLLKKIGNYFEKRNKCRLSYYGVSLSSFSLLLLLARSRCREELGAIDF